MNMPGENNRNFIGDIASTKQRGNTTGSNKKNKHSRNTDPFENVAISLDRY